MIKKALADLFTNLQHSTSRSTVQRKQDNWMRRHRYVRQYETKNGKNGQMNSVPVFRYVWDDPNKKVYH